MKASDRDLSRALASALVLAGVVILVVVLKLPGLFLSVALIAAVMMIGRRYQQPRGRIDAGLLAPGAR